MMIDTGPKFYSVSCMTLRSRSQTWNFYVNILRFRISLFPNPLMDLVHVWCDDRYWSKILHSAIPTPILDFVLKFVFNVCFCEVFDGLIHVWHSDRNFD